MRITAPLVSLLAAAPALVAQTVGPVFEPESQIPGSALFRCGTPSVTGVANPADAPDCSLNNTNPGPWAPNGVLRIPVVVHVISNSGGTGNISDALVQSQITVLNEDFRALPGTAGAGGFDTEIEFFLATTDPLGNPTNGITRHSNTTWFGDTGSYWTSIAWDTQRYLNIYTNNAGGGGVLGYVPGLPQSASSGLGTTADRVVCLWSAFGRPAAGGAPYNLGRTMTHEVGHYLGLYHTFQSGCGTASCYTTGDRICDTNAESGPRFGCTPSAVSCGNVDPVRNYMDYSDDACFTNFTAEQAARMRCTIANYRPNLAQPGGPLASATVRNGPGNYNVYTSGAPVLGQTMTSQAQVAGLPNTYTLGASFWFQNPATVPFPPYTLLVDINSTQIYQTPFVLPVFGIAMVWQTPIPNDPVFAGLAFSTQVLLLGNTDLGLTNAVDMVIGS
ncbi:MAG: zinc metalloprotease [Planctomycetota bacterium]